MNVRTLLAAGLIAAALTAGQAGAQGAEDGPAEVPPASYADKQYIDSRGCVYVRALFDGKVTWVPRLTAERKVLCGFAPSLAAAPAPAPAPAAEAPVAAEAPAAAPVPAPIREALADLPPDPKSAAAWDDEPVRAAPVRRRAAARKAPAVRTAPRAPGELYVPRGYRRVWEDDRLNPHRAVGTPEGEAQMAAIWSNTVPRRLVAPVARPARASARTVRLGRVTTPGQRYLQVAAFGAPEAARPTVTRLRGLGLPVRQASVRASGSPVTVILAGPFADDASLARAQATARRAGFENVIETGK